MAAQLTLNFAFNSLISQLFDGNSATSSITVADGLNIVRTLTNGTGANQGNRTFVDDRTVAASTADTINLQTFGGAFEPLTGNSYTLTRLRFLIVLNRSATQTLTVSSANVTGLITSGQTINPNLGALILIAGTGASDGWTIGGTSTVTLTNSSGASCSYSIVAFGFQ